MYSHSPRNLALQLFQEFLIGLYDPVEADLENFWNGCSARFLGERLQREGQPCNFSVARPISFSASLTTLSSITSSIIIAGWPCTNVCKFSTDAASSTSFRKSGPRQF